MVLKIGKLQPHRLLWNWIVIHTILDLMCLTTMIDLRVP